MSYFAVFCLILSLPTSLCFAHFSNTVISHFFEYSSLFSTQGLSLCDQASAPGRSTGEPKADLSHDEVPPKPSQFLSLP